ncbi:UNVERIFIED_ORG: hypothetical protein B2H93_20010, partial [Clostridium botulinum]
KENTNEIENKIDKSKIINNCLVTETGFVLDAQQGKNINDRLTFLEGVPYGALNVTSLKDIEKNIKIAFSEGNKIYTDYPALLTRESLLYGILTVTTVDTYRTFEIIATDGSESKVKKICGFGSKGKEIRWEE